MIQILRYSASPINWRFGLLGLCLGRWLRIHGSRLPIPPYVLDDLCRSLLLFDLLGSLLGLFLHFLLFDLFLVWPKQILLVLFLELSDSILLGYLIIINLIILWISLIDRLVEKHVFERVGVLVYLIVIFLPVLAFYSLRQGWDAFLMKRPFQIQPFILFTDQQWFLMRWFFLLSAHSNWDTVCHNWCRVLLLSKTRPNLLVEGSWWWLLLGRGLES